MTIVFLAIAGSQVLLTAFVVMIPINYSIQDTPNTVYTIVQGISALLLALVTYKVILDPKDLLSKGSLTIGDGVKKLLTKLTLKKEPSKLYKKKWEDLADEEKLAEVLYTIHCQELSNYDVCDQEAAGGGGGGGGGGGEGGGGSEDEKVVKLEMEEK